MRPCCTVIFALVILPQSIVAQTPEDVVQEYLESVKKDGFSGTVGLMHPEELQKFRQAMGPIVEGGLASRSEAKLFAEFSDPVDPKRMRPLSDFEFMTAYMRWIEAVRPNIAKGMATKVKTLGHVSEGDVKHVVVRVGLRAGDADIEKVTVFSVKEWKGKYRMLLSAEMKGMAEPPRKNR